MRQQIAMKTIAIYGLLCVLCAFAWSQRDSSRGRPEAAASKDLFAGDLSNALFSPGGWVMEDGVLVAKADGTIWTKESYGNFILDMEFMVAKDANSGVFLRTGDIKNIYSALEIQIHETTDGTKYGMAGALYDAKPPAKNVSRPAGEWNRYTITCRDSRLMLVFNGEQMLDLDLNDWKESKRNPDGTSNKFSVPLKDFSRSGPIGLQGLHGKEAAPVWFRNLKIRTLP